MPSDITSPANPKLCFFYIYNNSRNQLKTKPEHTNNGQLNALSHEIVAMRNMLTEVILKVVSGQDGLQSPGEDEVLFGTQWTLEYSRQRQPVCGFP